ncbi:hypothetical protein E4U17_005253 [Claviceps sp. LM77 group G4]|nr:hypothetical protein E4U17_005253 [Claviceps sp. LM77 group G4]KAG6072551.1 hypothetical protein E4U33_003223 [Claviceps sp. LM78 group G4]KAG6072746.1 hypothetical protein E4U16_005144 [Claviceps sp. LM84 group G4]
MSIPYQKLEELLVAAASSLIQEDAAGMTAALNLTEISHAHSISGKTCRTFDNSSDDEVDRLTDLLAFPVLDQ